MWGSYVVPECVTSPHILCGECDQCDHTGDLSVFMCLTLMPQEKKYFKYRALFGPVTLEQLRVNLAYHIRGALTLTLTPKHKSYMWLPKNSISDTCSEMDRIWAAVTQVWLIVHCDHSLTKVYEVLTGYAISQRSWKHMGIKYQLIFVTSYEGLIGLSSWNSFGVPHRSESGGYFTLEGCTNGRLIHGETLTISTVFALGFQNIYSHLKW